MNKIRASQEILMEAPARTESASSGNPLRQLPRAARPRGCAPSSCLRIPSLGLSVLAFAHNPFSLISGQFLSVLYRNQNLSEPRTREGTGELDQGCQRGLDRGRPQAAERTAAGRGELRRIAPRGCICIRRAGARRASRPTCNGSTVASKQAACGKARGVYCFGI